MTLWRRLNTRTESFQPSISSTDRWCKREASLKQMIAELVSELEMLRDLGNEEPPYQDAWSRLDQMVHAVGVVGTNGMIPPSTGMRTDWSARLVRINDLQASLNARRAELAQHYKGTPLDDLIGR